MNWWYWKEVDAVRRIAARHCGRWRATKTSIATQEDGVPVGDFLNEELADYVARLHNVFLPLTNALFELKARIADLALTKETK